MQETRIRSLGQEDPLEESMATHFSILAWEIPWIEERGGLQSMGSQRVRHDLATKTAINSITRQRRHCYCNLRGGRQEWSSTPYSPYLTTDIYLVSNVSGAAGKHWPRPHSEQLTPVHTKFLDLSSNPLPRSGIHNTKGVFFVVVVVVLPVRMLWPEWTRMSRS